MNYFGPDETRKNLTDSLYQHLKTMIVNNQLPPGEIVSIAALAQELKVSRTPVHAACQKLEGDRFLTIIPKQGVLITPMTVDMARETYELRAAIETYSFKRAFPNINREDIAYLEVNCAELHNYLLHDLIPEFLQTDTAFHRYLLTKYENSQFFLLMDNLFDRTYQIGLKMCSNGLRAQESYNEHIELLHAIKHNNLEAGLQAIEKNILNGYKSLTGYYQI